MEKNMANEATETEAPVTEEPTTTEPTKPADPLETLITEVDKSLESTTADVDLDYEPDDLGSATDVTPITGEETVETLKARLQEETRRRQRAENRSDARTLRDQIKGEYPNANPATVDKYMRLVASGQKTAESVKTILDASNRDYSRGSDASDRRWKARFEELQKTAKTEAEQVVENAWGSPPTGKALSGADKISVKQFEEALKDSRLTDLQAGQLADRVDWKR